MIMEQKYELEKHIGVLSEANGGWTREVNIISWYGKAVKFDIRDWCRDQEKIGKGLTLTEDEMLKLYELLKDYFGEGSNVQPNECENYENVDELFFK